MLQLHDMYNFEVKIVFHNLQTVTMLWQKYWKNTGKLLEFKDTILPRGTNMNLWETCLSCDIPAWRWCTGSCGWQTGWELQTVCSCFARGPWGDGLNVWTELQRSRQPKRPVFLPVKDKAQEAVRTCYTESWPEDVLLVLIMNWLYV